MDFEDFKLKLNKKLKEINLEIEEKQVNQYFNYMNLLIEWNKKINLTSIIEPEDIILKHFDNALVLSLVPIF